MGLKPPLLEVPLWGERERELIKFRAFCCKFALSSPHDFPATHFRRRRRYATILLRGCSWDESSWPSIPQAVLYGTPGARCPTDLNTKYDSHLISSVLSRIMSIA